MIRDDLENGLSESESTGERSPKVINYGTNAMPDGRPPSRLSTLPESMMDPSAMVPHEESPLLGDLYSKLDDDDSHTASIWKHEAWTIVQYSTPMCLTLLLQYSLTISSIFVVGHLGKEELGAVSLANMTAIISGYAIFQGFATSLDTLCPQAYGSGKFKLVGLHMQRLTLLLLLTTIPIAIIWLQADRIFALILPREDHEIALLAGQYLRIILIGAPGYACFEAGKRYVQAQGLFHASLHVLLICAPLNAFLSWYFVWQLDWGFVGAPISVAISQCLLPLLLLLHISFSTRHLPSCWHPLFSRALLQNWRPMLRLAIPGAINIESEFIAWEILTLISSYLGATALATQSALYTIVCITYQVSFSAGIGSSTRLAMLVGAGKVCRAKSAKRVAIGLAVFMGTLNVSALLGFRYRFPDLFTDDEDVKAIIRDLIPLCAALQIFDAINVTSNGILRSVGRPAIGSYIQLAFYYGVSLPLGIWLAFAADWGLKGIWVGMVVGMAGIGVVMLGIVMRVDWKQAVWEAEIRNGEEDDVA